MTAGPGVGDVACDEGGDPPCWEGLVVDQRDLQPARPDLTTPTQIHDLVVGFYREIVFDEVLEPYFGEVAEVDWAEHIPKLIDYWCWIVLARDPYPGAVTRTHRHLHGLQAITPEACDRWYALWSRSVEAQGAGPNADRARRHAALLMTGMAKRVFGFAWEPPEPEPADAGPGLGSTAR